MYQLEQPAIEHISDFVNSHLMQLPRYFILVVWISQVSERGVVGSCPMSGYIFAHFYFQLINFKYSLSSHTTNVNIELDRLITAKERLTSDEEAITNYPKT